MILHVWGIREWGGGGSGTAHLIHAVFLCFTDSALSPRHTRGHDDNFIQQIQGEKVREANERQSKNLVVYSLSVCGGG